MPTKKEENIFTVILPFYLIIKIFGLFPASFDGEPRLGIFQFKCRDRVSSLLSLIILFGVSILNILHPIEKLHKSFIITTGWQLSLFCGMILLIITMVYQLLKRHEIIKLLHILNDFDAKAKALEVKLNLKASRKFILKTVMFILCGVLVVSIGTAFIFEMKIHYGAGCLMPLSYGYLLLYLSMLILQFSFSTLAIKNRFCLLNDNLRFTFQNSLAKGNSTLANGNANRLHEQLSNTIRDLYSNLCDGIDLVNESLTFQLIPFMVYYLTANLFAIYSTIREVFYQTPLMYIAIGTNICWMILHSVIASIALYSGHITTKCALRTPIIVSSILRNCKDKESPFTKDAFKTFLLEVQHRNMFIENEFFRIDWKLLFSMISTITTFLVITCQFDASLSNDSVIKNSTLG